MSWVAGVFTPAAAGSGQTDSDRRSELADFLVSLIYNDNVDLDMLQAAMASGPNPHHGVVTRLLSSPRQPTGTSIRSEADGGYWALSAKKVEVESHNLNSQQPGATAGDAFGHQHQRQETSIGEGPLFIETQKQQEQQQSQATATKRKSPWCDYPSPHCDRQEGNVGAAAASPFQPSPPGHQYAARHPLPPESARDMLQPSHAGSADDFFANGGVPDVLAAVSPASPTPDPFYTHAPGLTYNPTPLLDFEFGSWDGMDYESSPPIQPQTASSMSSSSPPSASGLVATMTPDHDATDARHSTGELSSRPPSKKSPSSSQHLATARPHRPHSVVEKRYRAGINEKIEALRGCLESRKRRKGIPLHEALFNGPLPSHSDSDGQLQQVCGGGDEQHGHAIGSGTAIDPSAPPKTTGPTRMNKAEVMIEAVEYIQQLEEENEAMMDQLRQLVARLCATRRALLPLTPPAPSCTSDGSNSAGGGG